MTAATAQPKAKQQYSRIARWLLPQIDAHSALLPPDKWILKTAYEFVKDNKSFHDTMGRAAVYAGGGLLSVIAGTVGAIVLFPLALPMAAAGLAAAGAALFAGFRAKHHFDKFKEQTLPELRAEVGKKYLDYKMSELKAAWQRNMDERRKQREEAKKQKAEAKLPEAKKPEVKAETPKAETPKPETPKAETPKPDTAQQKKPSDKKTLGGAFAELARKMAEERARKLKEQEAKDKAAKDAPQEQKPAAPAKSDTPKPETPKPPAP